MQILEDAAIVDLYFARDEEALKQTASKFGAYLTKIAFNILTSRPDSEECVNDTYLKAWNVIPPQKPVYLGSFLSKITRNLSIDRLRRQMAKKRTNAVQTQDKDSEENIVSIEGRRYDLSLEELSESIPASGHEGSLPDPSYEYVEGAELGRLISAYLRTVSKEARLLFIYRYFDMESLKDSASYAGVTEANAKTLLYRTRLGLKNYLEKEGYLV
ncbi:MAG: RNA polymerase sigma factor [Firmicutes bacterium]|nr:RNA polymerase sigma factor [Bacillota bacterium]